MSRFVENAVKLMSAAESAVNAGHTPTDMTILISSEGGIRMVADSDWPLESLQALHGASTAYRVSRRNEKVRIEGREGVRTCLFESQEPQHAARMILGGVARYTMIGAAA